MAVLSDLTLRLYLQGRQAVVIGQLLGLLVPQVLDPQAEPQLLQRHRRHVVGHVVDLRVQRERWRVLRTHDSDVESFFCINTQRLMMISFLYLCEDASDQL